MEDYIRADKAYAVTADLKIVDPKHPAARQILSHYTGQEVPTGLMIEAGLADATGRLTPRDYDTVEAPAVAAFVPEGYVSKAESDAAIEAAVADALAKQAADAKNAKGTSSAA